MLDLTTLSEKEFENLTFDLLSALGLKNCLWRTPGSDVGRDIEGDFFFTDVSGYCQRQKWYVECKRYTNSIDWPTVWNKISYAEAHDADILLMSVTSSLSPQAIDQVNKWNEQKKTPIIRVLNSADISNKLRLYPHIAIKYGFLKPSESNIAISVFPLVRLLLKASYSLSSGIAVGVNVETKADLTQALTDLIAVRIEDFRSEGKIQAYKYVDSEDRYDWIKNSKCIENTNFDRYGLRALFTLIRFQAKLKTVNIATDIDGRIFVAGYSIDEKQNNQLQNIASCSNFHVIISEGKIILEE